MKRILLSSVLAVSVSAIAAHAASDVSRGEPFRAGGPTRPTETALGCMLGYYAPQTCMSLFAANATLTTFWQINRRLHPDPYFRTARFTGTNRAGEEIWDVKFVHREETYVIAPPDSDGKIRKVTILVGPPNTPCTNLVGALSAGEIMNAPCLF
jgi:hypothetical protein